VSQPASSGIVRACSPGTTPRSRSRQKGSEAAKGLLQTLMNGPAHVTGIDASQNAGRETTVQPRETNKAVCSTLDASVLTEHIQTLSDQVAKFGAQLASACDTFVEKDDLLQLTVKLDKV
jgi:hypothetical protein